MPDHARSQLAALQALLPGFRQAPAFSGRLQREMARVADRIGDPAMAERLLVGAEKGLEGDPEAAAEAANALGMVRLALLRPAEAAADFGRSVAVLARTGIVQGELVVAALVNLANARLDLGAPDQAIECVARARTAAGSDEALLRRASYGEALVKVRQPDLVGAERILEQLAAAPEDDPIRGHALLLQATTRFNLGLLPEADRKGVAAADAYRMAFGEASPDFAQALHLLGTTHERLRDPDRAKEFFERAADIRKRAFGPTSLQLNATEIERAWLDVQNGQLTDAEQRSRAALDAFRQASPPQKRYEGLAHVLLGLIAEARGQTGGAAAEFRAGQFLIAAGAGQDSPDLGFSLVRLGRLLTRDGRHAEAGVPLDRAIALYRRLGSGDTVRLADALAARADLRARQGDLRGALDDSRRSYDALRTRWNLDADAAGLAGAYERNSARNLFAAHARMVLRLEPTDAGREEAFAATQNALDSRVGDVLRRAAARAATADNDLGLVLHARVEAADNLRQIEANALQALSRGPLALGTARSLAGWQKQWQDTLAKADKTLGNNYEGFSQFAFPQPVSFAQLQAVLDPEEALLLSSSERDDMLLWAVTRDGVDAVTITLGEKEAADLVRRIRAGVNLDLIPPQGVLPSFDFEAARRLYSSLIEPVRGRFEGKRRLIFALDGVLQTFPPYLMVGGQSNSWLIREFAAAVTPSPAAFVAGRTTYTPSTAFNAFLGIGNPDFGSFVRFGPAGKSAESSLRELSWEERETLAGLKMLPDTAREVSEMARLFPDGQTDLILGMAASKGGLNSEIPGTYRVIAFATHALMSKEITGVAEPAIVLSCDGHSEAPDGLLLASEIATMKLNADLVILSGCNTATPEQGPLADNFSGLVRAVLHAGARATLVSHWSVSSEPTVGLTAGFVKEWHSDEHPRKAEALRRSMLHMLDSGDAKLAHPSHWAPFVIVGD